MKKLRQLLNLFTLYLPVLLMGLLAMATYWLVRSSPAAPKPEVAHAIQHQSDYFMRQFAVRTYDASGRLKSEVKGTQVRHFPDSDTLEIDQAQIRSFNEQNRLTTASAEQAITNSDASEVQLIGHAQVQRAASVDSQGNKLASLKFQGEFLHAFMNTERVLSHKPVQLTRGQDQFTADSMEFDNLQRVISLKGRVRGMLTPGMQP